MGHAHISTTEIYAHYQRSGQGAEKISAAFNVASEPVITAA